MARNIPLVRISFLAVCILFISLPGVLMGAVSAGDNNDNIYEQHKREAGEGIQKSNFIRAATNKPAGNLIPDNTTKIIHTASVARSKSSFNETDKKEKNCTGSENCKSEEGMVNYVLKKMSDNSDMLLRTMFVLFGVTGIVIVYFVVKAIRMRRRRSKSRKYGVITKGGENMEMEPLGDGNEDDDDYTVFEMNGRRN